MGGGGHLPPGREGGWAPPNSWECGPGVIVTVCTPAFLSTTTWAKPFY